MQRLRLGMVRNDQGAIEPSELLRRDGFDGRLVASCRAQVE